MCRICTKAIESKPPAADDLPLRGLAFERRLRQICVRRGSALGSPVQG